MPPVGGEDTFGFVPIVSEPTPPPGCCKVGFRGRWVRWRAQCREMVGSAVLFNGTPARRCSFTSEDKAESLGLALAVKPAITPSHQAVSPWTSENFARSEVEIAVDPNLQTIKTNHPSTT